MQNVTSSSELTSEFTCRTCLGQYMYYEMHYLFEIENVSQKLIADILMTITQLQIKFNDRLPKKICNECTKKIVDSYNFKVQAERNDKTLINYFKKSQTTVYKAAQEYTEEISLKTEKVAENDLSEHEETLNNDNNEDDTEYLPCENFLEPIHKSTDDQNQALEQCVTDKRPDLICKQCNLAFEYEIQLINHACNPFGPITNVTIKNKNDDISKLLSTAETSTSFFCNICMKSFTREYNFKRHLKTHETVEEKNLEGSNTNNEQEQSDNSKDRNNTTDKKRTSKEKRFPCLNCGKMFTQRDNLQRHLKLHKPDNEKEFECHLCQKRFYRKDHLQKHLRVHEKQNYELDRKFICDVCGKTFTRERILLEHSKIHRSEDEKMFECEVCKKRFHRKDRLKEHSVVHKDEKPFKCDICNKCFKRSSDLSCHKSIHTSGIAEEYECKTCNRKFSTKYHMDSHMTTHNKTQKETTDQYLCPICGVQLSSSSGLYVHLRRHQGIKPHKCAMCGKGFTRPIELRCHEKTHTGEKSWLCTICGRGFSRKSKLQRHTRTHTGEKPYKCTYEFCDRAFAQSSELTVHLRRHIGNKPFGCKICGKNFIQRWQLKQHQRVRKHLVEDDDDENKFIGTSVNNPNRIIQVSKMKNAQENMFAGRDTEDSLSENDEISNQQVLDNSNASISCEEKNIIENII